MASFDTTVVYPSIVMYSQVIMPMLNFNIRNKWRCTKLAARRLQLAAEQSRVTGLLSLVNEL
jgi:hypothetical protein